MALMLNDGKFSGFEASLVSLNICGKFSGDNCFLMINGESLKSHLITTVLNFLRLYDRATHTTILNKKF